jgi:hypothetical protein
LKFDPNDPRAADAVRAIDDPASRAALDAERAVVTRLGGGCQMPIGAHAGDCTATRCRSSPSYFRWTGAGDSRRIARADGGCTETGDRWLPTICCHRVPARSSQTFNGRTLPSKASSHETPAVYLIGRGRVIPA